MVVVRVRVRVRVRVSWQPLTYSRDFHLAPAQASLLLIQTKTFNPTPTLNATLDLVILDM